MLLVVYAHPHPDRSRAGKCLLEEAEKLEGVVVHSLYDTYPAFDVDIPREQARLREASAIVLQHPLYWYSVPGLMKHWLDVVWVRGFAYGDRKDLAGKPLLWVPTTGGDDEAYSSRGVHGRSFADYAAPIERLALFCGMQWEEPFVVHGAHRISDAALAVQARSYSERLRTLLASARVGEAR